MAALLTALAALLPTVPASAHSLPISSLDIEYSASGIEGRVIIHMRDLAGDLDLPSTGRVPNPTTFIARATAIDRVLIPRLLLGGQRVNWGAVTPAPQDRDALQLDFALPGPPPAKLTIATALVPRDPNHQTFVNLYEGGELRQQWLLGAASPPVTYYAGSRAGLLAAAGAFVQSGVHHILIGPDHIAFVIGLILLGGTLVRLATIVTAFTLGHSVTLTLAATGTLMLPEQLVEPAIALSIVVVGVDNLLRGEGRDIRAGLAFAFGLVHGFGFAYVLRAFGLPEAHRVVALVSFNLGVEVGQMLIVIPMATALALLRRHRPVAARRAAIAGSLAVTAAGGYWFITRILSGAGA